VFIRAFIASLTAAGALVRAVAKNIQGSSATAGQLSKSSSKPLSGSSTPAGTLARLVTKAIAASVTAVGTVQTSVGALFNPGAVRLAGSVVRRWIGSASVHAPFRYAVGLRRQVRQGGAFVSRYLTRGSSTRQIRRDGQPEE
jgi:hypothetical protein